MKRIPAYHRWWRYKSYLPDATLPAHTVECPDCGCRMDIPRLRQGQEAHCPVCNHEIVEVENNPYIAPIAYALTTLILMAFAYNMVYIRVDLFGVTSILSLPQMMRLLISLDYGFLAEVMFILTFGAPLLFLLLCLYVYTALIREKAYPALRFATRVLVRLRHWIMVDVFFYFHSGGVYQALVRCYGRIRLSVLSDVSIVGHADSDFGIDSAALGLL